MYRFTCGIAMLGGRRGASIVDLPSAVWRKSTLSTNGSCVEVAIVDDYVAVRDSKDQHGSVLLFTAAKWKAFAGGVRQGEFDVP